MKKQAMYTHFFDKRLVIVGCFFFVQVTATAQPRVVKSLLEIRQQQVVIQQFDLSCGAAALATLLRFQFGENVTEREIAIALMRREAYLANPDLIRQHQGFSLLDLKRYVQSRGYDGMAFGALQFDDLLRLAPIMVPLNLHGYQHFVIVRDSVNSQVMLADPAWGNRTMQVGEFMRVWVNDPQLGRVGFLIQAQDKRRTTISPAPSTEDTVLLNAMDW